MTQQGDIYDYAPGTLIPGAVYRVIQPLGQGGMGTVYLVEDTTIGKRYALKTINREFADRMDMAARMRNEARALVSLRHPNIVDVITLGQTQDEHKLVFIVMEYLEGSTLKGILRGRGRNGRLELPHVLDIAIDVADALEKAHSEGFVHRDIKPDNIFLVVALEGMRAKAVVLDFGIIGLRGKEAAEDRGQFMGTPRYGAPEQARGGRCVAESDLYALAVVMFESLAGHGPFPRAKGALELAHAHLNDPVPRLSTFVPEVNRDLDDLIYAALQKDPSARVLVDKTTRRRMPLTAARMGSELRRIRREEDARLSQHVDDNKTQETLLGALHGDATPESTVDDPNIVERLAAEAPGRKNTLMGLAPVDQGARRESEPSGPGRSAPARTPLVSGSRQVFPAPEVSPDPDSPQPDELLSHLGGGRALQYRAAGAAAIPHAAALPPRVAPPPFVAPGRSLVGVQAVTDPLPPPLATRPAALAGEASPAPEPPDSWRRVQAAMAVAEQVATAGKPRAGHDEMEAAKARVPLVGPAAGRRQASTPPTDCLGDHTDSVASRTVDAPPPGVPERRFRTPHIVAVAVVGACITLLACAGVIVALRAAHTASTVSPAVSAPSTGVGSPAVEPERAEPAPSSASSVPTPPAVETGSAPASSTAISIAPVVPSARVPTQPGKLTHRQPSRSRRADP